MSAGLLAGLDIGGSKLHAVAVAPGEGSQGARVVGSVRLPTRATPDGVVDGACAALNALAGHLGPGQEIRAVGIGVPGLVDAARGTVTHAVNLGVADGGLPLAELVRERTRLPVTVENDVNAAAVGAGQIYPEHRDLAYISIGTGIAAGIVLDGELRRGPRGAVGEIGHIPVDPAGPACSCGQRGCLEAVASGRALAQRWPAGGLGAARSLVEAAGDGDPRAGRVLAGLADHLAAAVRMLALTLDVDLVVLGGGVADAGDPLRAAVADALDRQAAGSPFLQSLRLASRVAVVTQDRLAALGAALLALDLVPGGPAGNGRAARLPAAGQA